MLVELPPTASSVTAGGLYGSHFMLAHEPLLLNEGQGGVVHAPGAGVGGKRRQDAVSAAGIE
jgi:hypothetical protein